MLAAGALVASLLAVGAGPAVALDEDSKVNSPAATSACVGVANDDMMFSDVSEGHYFRDAINCLAYYGVTVGFGDGTFQPNEDVARADMVRFMERAAAVAGADAEAVVGDFAETGSDPVHRGDMALLIARLLVAATDKGSAVNVTNNDDGTFTLGDAVGPKDWDYFADSRRSQNRVHDSAASALYELGVAKGTGMGYFSPASTVNRGAMAAFITRALAHTTARPAGVTIQSPGAGEVIVSVRDANFHPVANEPVDVFSVSTARVDEAFNEDGSCNKPRLRGEGGNTMVCEIDTIDAVTGLNGDYMPGNIAGVQPGGRTVFAWTGDSGDKVEDGAEGLAHIPLTKTPPVDATGAKITTDLGKNVARAAFGSTVTVTIQLVGANDADAVPPATGVTYNVVTRSQPMSNQASDAIGDGSLIAVEAGTTVRTQTVPIDAASGKGTLTITAADPDPNDANDDEGASVDWVTVSIEATTSATGLDSASLAVPVQTIRFSDAPSMRHHAEVTPAAKYLMAPTSGKASNAATVKVTDQYGNPVRGHMVVLDGSDDSTFPTVARRTDSSGTARIGYSYGGNGAIEELKAQTAGETPTDIPGGTAMVYWVSTPTDADVTAAVLRVADVEKNTLVIGAEGGVPQLLVYDDNDQFAITKDSATTNSTMAAFEEELAKFAKEDTGQPDEVGVTQYDPDDASVVARFTLAVN